MNAREYQALIADAQCFNKLALLSRVLMEGDSMKSATRTVTLAAAVSAGVAIGFLLGSSFSVSSANAASPMLTPTGSLFLPGDSNTYAGKFEDTEAGVVCYVFNNKLGVSCVKK